MDSKPISPDVFDITIKNMYEKLTTIDKKFDNFIEAHKGTDEKRDEEISHIKDRLSVVETKQKLLQWAVGITTTSVGILIGVLLEKYFTV